MNKQIEEVRTFMIACGQAAPDEPIQSLEESVANLRVKLIAEELNELGVALGLDILVNVTDYECPLMFDQVEVIDALADLLYVVYGCAVAVGHHKLLPKAFQKVHFSNMTKVDAETGKCEKDGMGKIMKPAGYIPPALESLFE